MVHSYEVDRTWEVAISKDLTEKMRSESHLALGSPLRAVLQMWSLAGTVDGGHLTGLKKQMSEFRGVEVVRKGEAGAGEAGAEQRAPFLKRGGRTWAERPAGGAAITLRAEGASNLELLCLAKCLEVLACCFTTPHSGAWGDSYLLVKCLSYRCEDWS